MTLKVVSNSTPLIALTKINRLNILQEIFGSIIIPEAVYIEVAEDKKSRAGSDEIASSDWIVTEKVTNRLAIDFLSINIDLGEAEAITLASEIKADLLLLDDRAGRKVAKSVGIPVTGTVGLLLRFYKGKPDEFKLALDKLIANGFRLSAREYNRVLKLAGF